MSQPLVSVVTPARDAAAFIESAIASALSQTYRPLEIIVVDDGSKDDTARIVGSMDGPVRCLAIPPSGVSIARNRGVAEARGSLLAFLDADDEWAPRKLDVQVRRLATRPDAVASFCAFDRSDERSGHVTRVVPHRGSDMCEALLLGSTLVGPPSVAVVRRDAFERAGGFDPAIAQGEDWDLWLRLAVLGVFDLVDEPLVRIRIHGRNASLDVWGMERDNLKVLAKFFRSDVGRGRYALLRRRAYGTHHLLFAGSYWRAGDVGRAVRSLARAVTYRPLALVYAAAMPLRALSRALARARSVVVNF